MAGQAFVYPFMARVTGEFLAQCTTEEGEVMREGVGEGPARQRGV